MRLVLRKNYSVRSKPHSLQEKFIKYGILILFPWRDAFAVPVGNTQIRFGEIYAFIIAILGLLTGRALIKKSELKFSIVLFVNLIITLMGVLIYRDNIDTSFSNIYVLRNVIYLLCVLGFTFTNIKFDENDIDFIMRYTVILELAVYIVLILSGNHLYLGRIAGWDEIISAGQYLNIGPLRVPRFMGTTAEAGYLGPILVMPIYYYLSRYINRSREVSKHTKAYLIVSLFLCVVTFSVAVYLFAILAILISFANNATSNRKLKFIGIGIIAVIILLAVIESIPQLRDYFNVNFVNKISTYMGSKTAYNWSANDRSQHYRAAWDMFITGNPIQWILGHGTGAYYAMAKSNARFLVNDVNEAYNLYLSTLTDRGILGLFCIIIILVNIIKIRDKSLASRTIFIGLVFQFIHWLLTGNFWLYYFWYEVMILIGLHRYYTAT